MTIKLHCFGESGNSYKAALALEMSGLEWEPVFVDFFNGQTRTPETRQSATGHRVSTSPSTRTARP